MEMKKTKRKSVTKMLRYLYLAPVFALPFCGAKSASPLESMAKPIIVKVNNDTVTEEQLKRKKLINKFISLVANSNENINLNIIDTSMISTEMLTNLGSLILPLENEDKQKLLELNDVELRLEVLCQFLDSELKVESDLINFNQIIPTNINWN